MIFNARFLVIWIYFLSINLFSITIKYMEVTNFLGNYFFPDKTTENSVYDYIVVGSGSAGSIISRRLAEDKNVKVLVLEAGGQRHSLLNVPPVGLMLQQTSFDWQYKTEPQSKACFALDNKQSLWPRGKIMGGTSMFNNMLYVRGHRNDFDHWFKNKEDYDYDNDVLPYFNKLEDDLKGSIIVKDLKYTSILVNNVLKAAKYLGFPTSEPNVDCNYEFAKPKVNMVNGERYTTSHTLLKENKPNVFLINNAVVQKILFKNDFEANGVKYEKLGKYYHAKASKGVILSSGVIETPKLLMLSGIGDANHLNSLNIRPKINLPSIGLNLQDHLTTGFDLILLNQTMDNGISVMMSPLSIFEYFYNAGGPWTTVGCELIAFFDTAQLDCSQLRRKCEFTKNEPPNLQLMIMPLGISDDDGIYLRKLMGISDKSYNNYFAFLNQTTPITFLPVLLHPKSKGFVRLRNKNVNTPPIINPNYLKEQEDVDVLWKGIQLIKKIVKSEPMQKLGAKLNDNVFPGCENHEFDTKLYWECYIRHLTISSYHPVGTCKMGNDENSVVNYNFQVKGTNKLFIVDGSVPPSLTSANVNAAIMMLAEMASDAVKFIEYLSTGHSFVMNIFIPKNFC